MLYFTANTPHNPTSSTAISYAQTGQARKQRENFMMAEVTSRVDNQQMNMRNNINNNNNNNQCSGLNATLQSKADYLNRPQQMNQPYQKAFLSQAIQQTCQLGSSFLPVDRQMEVMATTSSNCNNNNKTESQTFEDLVFQLQQMQFSTQSSSPDEQDNTKPLRINRNSGLVATKGSTGIAKRYEVRRVNHSDFDYEEPSTDCSTKREHIVSQMECCHEVEDFSVYIQEYERNLEANRHAAAMAATVVKSNMNSQSDDCFAEIATTMKAPQHDCNDKSNNNNNNNSKKALLSSGLEEFYQEKLFNNKEEVVPRYAFEIVQNMFKQQDGFRLLHADTSDVKDLVLRENLIDLLSIMHSKLKLQTETLFLASNILSLYLDRSSVSTSTLHESQLIIMTSASLFIAAKYQEIYPPALRDFSEMLTQYVSVQVQQATRVIIDCEGAILNSLGFQLFGPTRLAFFEAYLTQTDLDDFQKNFCLYMLELSICNHAFVCKYAHSEVAAAVILLSEKFKNVSGRYFWSENLEILTTYKQPDLYACVEELYEYLVNVGKNRQTLNVYAKFTDSKFKGVSLIDYDLSNNINNNSAIATTDPTNNQGEFEQLISQQQQQRMHGDQQSDNYSTNNWQNDSTMWIQRQNYINDIN